MCTPVSYQVSKGDIVSYNISSKLSSSGCNMIGAISKFAGGKHKGSIRRKKKRFAYNNETIAYLQNVYKTGRHKYYFSRRIVKNKRPKIVFFRDRTKKNNAKKFVR